MNRDAKFINFSEVHELDYILKKYGKETSKENRDLLKEFGKQAKELLELEERIDILEKSILHKAFKGELGTQNNSDESAIELLKEIL